MQQLNSFTIILWNKMYVPLICSRILRKMARTISLRSQKQRVSTLFLWLRKVYINYICFVGLGRETRYVEWLSKADYSMVLMRWVDGAKTAPLIPIINLKCYFCKSKKVANSVAMNTYIYCLAVTAVEYIHICSLDSCLGLLHVTRIFCPSTCRWCGDLL